MKTTLALLLVALALLATPTTTAAQTRTVPEPPWVASAFAATRSMFLSDGTQTPDMWTHLQALAPGTRVRLTLLNGTEIEGGLVEIRSDSVVLMNQLRKGQLRTREDASLTDALTFQRVDISNVRLPDGVHTFAELQQTLKAGQKVVVTDESGQSTRGEVEEISSSSLTLRTTEKRRDAAGREYDAGTRRQTFASSAVIEVRTRDRLWDGTLIGLGVGFLAGVVATGPCADEDCNADLVYNIAYSIILSGPVVGSLIDWAHERTVYQASRSSVRLSPWIGKRRGGVSLSIGF